MVSVIITTYNRDASILLKAVKSAAAQTVKELEIIVVDDNPPDAQAAFALKDALCSLGDERIRYVPHDKNRGACAARNTGIDNSRGEYICFLDDDDEYLPQKLERQLGALENNSAASIAFCDFYVRTFRKMAGGAQEKKAEESAAEVTREKKAEDSAKERAQEKNNTDHVPGAGNPGGADADFSLKYVKLPYSEDRIYDQIFLGNRIATPNPLIKRECFEECGCFDVTMPAAQDMELWIRILKKFPAVIVREPLYYQNVHGGERISVNYEKKLLGNRLLIEKNLDHLQRHKKAHAYLVMVQAKRHIQLRDKQEIKSLGEAVKINPKGILKYIALLIYWKRKYG